MDRFVTHSVCNRLRPWVLPLRPLGVYVQTKGTGANRWNIDFKRRCLSLVHTRRTVFVSYDFRTAVNRS